jgi:putative SOS response-associated peptidase YedK
MEMCTRFTIASGVAAIEREFQAEFQFAYEKVYNAHFGMELPVIVTGEENKILSYRWGLVPFWSREPNLKFHHINSPARNIVKNPVYRVPIRRKRCLVIANCFFIWTRSEAGARVPMVVYDGAQRLLSFAGIWDTWENKEKSRMIHSFSIVTTHANRRLKNFTGTMPVIIPPGRRRKYLRDSCHLNEVMAMLRPFESDTMNLYPVSTAVNSFSNNCREVVMPVGERIYKEYEYVPKVYLKLEGMGSMKDNPGRKPEFKLMI